MTPVVINITGLQSADILAFFRKYSVEQHLRQLIDDFMPTFYLTGDDPRDVERDNPKDTAVYDGELDYEVPGDGRLYKNVNNEQYSFDVEEEELIPPSAEETEKYYIITNHFSFYALFEKAVLKQQNVAKDKIITTIYQFPGSEKSLFKTIYQDCDLFLENVSNSSSKLFVR